MAHARQQIREAVAAVLTPAVAPAPVHKSRIYQLPKDTEAAVLVYTRADEPDYDDVPLSKPRSLFRDLSVTIEILYKATATFDDDVDALITQVEKAIGADPTLSGKVLDMQLGQTSIDVDSDGETPVGYASVEYLTRYRVLEDDPEVLT